MSIKANRRDNTIRFHPLFFALYAFFEVKFLVLETKLAARGGQRLVTYLRLAEIKPPSRLPLATATPAPERPPRKRRRATTR